MDLSNGLMGVKVHGGVVLNVQSGLSNALITLQPGEMPVGFNPFGLGLPHMMPSVLRRALESNPPSSAGSAESISEPEEDTDDYRESALDLSFKGLCSNLRDGRSVQCINLVLDQIILLSLAE